MARDIKFLKEVLSVPSYTGKEEMMVQFIVDWLKSNNIEHYVDESYNVYAIKKDGTLNSNDYYPCVVSHTDTVHDLDSINIKEEMLPNADGELKLSLKAYDDFGNPTGIGGDDKCGIFACLELLKEMPNLKAAFFVSEETGCHGSRKADKRFFSDVGYAIQFDAPENWMVTETCFGKRLFDKSSDFFQTCDGILNENMSDRKEYMSHPYTDVWALKGLFDFSCINFSIGYYKYHTANEYVVIEDTFNGTDIGKKMIEQLGYKKYSYLSEKQKFLF